MADPKLNLDNLDFSGLDDIDKLDLSGLDELSETTDSASSSSLPEALALGGLQGLSLGFADELEGGAKALLSDETKDLETLKEQYKKFRDLAREKYEVAQEEHPYASFAGEVVGGLPLGFGVAKSGIAAAKFAPKAGTLTGDVTSLINKISPGMKEAILAGMTGGLGHSEGETIGDQAESALLGGATAAGTLGLGKLAKETFRVGKSAVEGISKLRPAQEVFEVFERPDLYDLTEEGRKKAFKEGFEEVTDIKKQIQGITKDISKEYENLLNPKASASEAEKAFAATKL
jgi:hypothetical protein